MQREAVSDRRETHNVSLNFRQVTILVTLDGWNLGCLRLIQQDQLYLLQKVVELAQSSSQASQKGGAKYPHNKMF